ncbi:MAG: bifunctional folylpolyglutamate synthase/dihydrofolate synthase [Saprospiraceae bacterium]
MKNIIQDLISLPKYGKGIGLHRMNALTEDLQKTDWWQTIKPINIVGTDGKGSTSAIITTILSALNISFGRYTSPHLFDFGERMLVDNQLISIEELEVIANSVSKKKAIFLQKNKNEQFNAFETFTAIALQHFYNKKTKTVVLEAGIGGRYDSTRILTGDFAALTSVSLEHTEILGVSEDLIAFDKMDILNTSGTLVVGQMKPHLLTKIKNYGKIKGIEVLCIQDYCQVHQVKYLDNRMLLDLEIDNWRIDSLEINLLGEHQISNVQVAVLLLKRWLKKYYPKISAIQFKKAINLGLKQIDWKGRFQRIHQAPNIYIDVGHTVNAFRLLASSIQKMTPRKWLLVVGFSHKKPFEKMLRELLPIADKMICTSAYHRGSDIEILFETAQKLNSNNIEIKKTTNIESAIDHARIIALAENMDILIVGGLFLAIESHHYINGNDAKSLAFF